MWSAYIFLEKLEALGAASACTYTLPWLQQCRGFISVPSMHWYASLTGMILHVFVTMCMMYFSKFWKNFERNIFYIHVHVYHNSSPLHYRYITSLYDAAGQRVDLYKQLSCYMIFQKGESSFYMRQATKHYEVQLYMIYFTNTPCTYTINICLFFSFI